MTTPGRVIEAREALLVAALKVLSAERAGMAAQVVNTLRADEELYLAARNVTRAVDGLQPARQPKGWAA